MKGFKKNPDLPQEGQQEKATCHHAKNLVSWESMTSDMVPFSYQTLDANLADELKRVAERIRHRLKKTAEDIIAIGQDLLTVKDKLDHGHFGEWIKAEFGITPRTAQMFMNAAEVFIGKSEIISLLTPTALCELAAPSTLKTVQEEVMARAAKGESFTVQQIKELKAQAQTAHVQRQEAERQMIQIQGDMQKSHARIKELNDMLAELQSQPPKVIEKEKIPEGYKTVQGAIKGLETQKTKLEKEVQEHLHKLSTLEANVERGKQLQNFQRQLKHLRERLVTMETTIEEDRLLAFLSTTEATVKEELEAVAQECNHLAKLIHKKLADPKVNVIEVIAKRIE